MIATESEPELLCLLRIGAAHRCCRHKEERQAPVK